MAPPKQEEERAFEPFQQEAPGQRLGCVELTLLLKHKSISQICRFKRKAAQNPVLVSECDHLLNGTNCKLKQKQDEVWKTVFSL